MEKAVAPSATASVETSWSSSYMLRHMIELDTKWSLQIHTFCQPIIPRSILKALEISGDGRFWIPIPIAAFFFFGANTNFTNSTTIFIGMGGMGGLFIGFLLDLLFVGLIKFLVKRPRPLYNKGMHLTVAVDHWSFPSGHSSRVCFIASFFYLLLQQQQQQQQQRLGASAHSHSNRDGGKFVNNSNVFVFLLILWSTFTSISRVLLGRHFVFDVIAGACLGLFEAQLVFTYYLNLF